LLKVGKTGLTSVGVAGLGLSLKSATMARLFFTQQGRSARLKQGL